MNGSGPRQEGAAAPAAGALHAGPHTPLAAEYPNLLACVRCGLCLTSCPTYVLSLDEAEGPRGRVAMARALLEGRLAPSPDLVRHELSCLVCDACSAVCPAGVYMEPIQIALRATLESGLGGDRPPHSPWQRTLRRLAFRFCFGSMARFRLIARLLWLYQHLGVRHLTRATGLLQLLRLQRSEALLPEIDARFLMPRGEVYPAAQAHDQTPPHGEAHAAPPTVSFFAGCIMSTALAEIDRATIRVLQRAGYHVANTAGQGCCGALNAHGGDLHGARDLARRNIAAFERDGQAPVVVNSAGCGAMLKSYAHLLRDDSAWAERAAAFSARVQDVTELLAGRDLPLRRALRLVATYQDPCHLAHAQRVTQQPRALLQRIPGLVLREMRESTLCCGSAGIYMLTHPHTARQLQQRKLDCALATQPDIIVTANPGCLLQLQSGLRERGSPVQVRHIIELLDEATRA